MAKPKMHARPRRRLEDQVFGIPGCRVHVEVRGSTLLPFAFSSVPQGAVGDKVFITVAPFRVAFHDFTIAVLRVLAASESLATRVAPSSFSFVGEEGLDIVLRVHEGLATLTRLALSFAVSFTFTLHEVTLDHLPEAANWSASKPAPIPLRLAMLEEELLGRLCL